MTGDSNLTQNRVGFSVTASAHIPSPIPPPRGARRAVRSVVIPAALCVLASCVTAPAVQKADNPEPTTTGAPSSPPVIVNTEPTPSDPMANGHIQKAMTALQAGQEANAKKELDTLLRQEPENKVARSLLAQIKTDPATYFGDQDSFNYTMQPGDTLSSIAQRFLNEPLKFYILARFNGITDPSRVVPGRIIKVPGKKPASPVATVAPGASPGDSPPVARVEPTRAGGDTRTQQARRFYVAGKYQQAIETLQGGGTVVGDARELLILSYGKYAEELARSENLIDAQSVLESALSIQPGNERLRKQLRLVEKQREVARLYKAGTESMVAGDGGKAVETFNAVLKLDPKHEAAMNHIASINADSVDAMHKDAMLEYSKQNLDQAIAIWDRALAVLPNHADAKFYRARALDLKSRLQKLDQKPAE